MTILMAIISNAQLASLYHERAIARAWAARRDPKKNRRFRRLEVRNREVSKKMAGRPR